MKEYKVVFPDFSLRNRHQKLEDLLNKYAREGWNLKHLGESWSTIVLERDKNR